MRQREGVRFWGRILDKTNKIHKAQRPGSMTHWRKLKWYRMA